jgi:hypothetical protein
VLSLLANEEWQPQTVIPMLKPNLRMKVYTHTLAQLNPKLNYVYLRVST